MNPLKQDKDKKLEDNMITDARNLFSQKIIDDNKIKDVRNLFKQRRKSINQRRNNQKY